jgi:tRNA-2-methylthio-N6-dimethylallyladenosine synthase
VRTFGCQMNVHDSERISGLLDEAGYLPVEDGATPDLVVFNTCAVRENADNKLYGNLGHLKPLKEATPGMQIAVGGCLAQKDQGLILQKAPYVDVVFGTWSCWRPWRSSPAPCRPAGSRPTAPG